MKKILNRIAAAAIAVPMALTQSVVMNISAEDAGVKVLTLDTFMAIPADQTESTWNTKVLNMAASMEGTQKEISIEDFVALLPEHNAYTVMIKEIMAGASNPILTVNNGVVSVKATVNMTSYAESNVYSKVREALVEKGYTEEVTMDEFNKTIELVVTADASVLAKGKEVNADYTLTADGENIKDNMSGYFKGLAAQLVASVAAQVGADPSEIADAMDVDLINKIETTEKYMAKAATFERSGSYATADEMLAAISKFVAGKTQAYKVPASVDEAVARHGASFNKVVDLISDITTSSGYAIDVTADDVAALAKSGSNFEAAASAGTYTLTFQVPDAEAAEVETYVNANAEAGKAYDYSYKLVEAKASVTGAAYFNVTRVIVMKDVEDSKTTTTSTTVSSGSTTTTTTTTSGSDSSDSTTTTTTTTSGSDSSTTTTSTTVSGDSSTTPSETTDTTLPEGFVLESVEVEAGKGYYFSHDENAFDLTELVNSLTLVGTLEDAPYTVKIAPASFNKYLKPAYATPAEYFNAVEDTAYVASELALTFVPADSMEIADDADLTIVNGPTVYIGVKGDSDLNGTVEITDASLTLAYYANRMAMLDASFNEDADLNTLAYFLSDVDTESKAGADSDAGTITITDATNILKYYANKMAMLDTPWSDILA